MKLIVMFLITLFSFCTLSAQNVGIDNPNPSEKLDVNGNIKADYLKLSTGGEVADFLMKSNADGTVGFRKGHGAQAINYIIAVGGVYPSTEGSAYYDVTILGEIKLFAGTILPPGWKYCNGQIMTVGSNTALFSLIGYAYGGSGNNFALPDLRGAAPVSAGTSSAGYTWTLGQKSD